MNELEKTIHNLGIRIEELEKRPRRRTFSSGSSVEEKEKRFEKIMLMISDNMKGMFPEKKTITVSWIGNKVTSSRRTGLMGGNYEPKDEKEEDELFDVPIYRVVGIGDISTFYTFSPDTIVIRLHTMEQIIVDFSFKDFKTLTKMGI